MDQIERRDTIRAELERRAKERKTITYGEVATMVGLVPNGLGRDLSAIKGAEAERNRPDLGCLVINRRTGFPGYIGTGKADRANAMEVREAVFRAWTTSES